jgi:hypothetical protein
VEAPPSPIGRHGGPELIEQTISADRLARLDEQQGEEVALLGGRGRDVDTIDHGPQRAEEVEAAPHRAERT